MRESNFKNTMTMSYHHEPLALIDENRKNPWNCINNLSQEQRSLIVLRLKMKLTVEGNLLEIYELSGRDIKSRLFYAIQELSKLYKI